MDSGSEAIEDADELQWVRRQALRVHVKAVVSAVLLTGIFVVV
jgi:hypothetical protein